MVALGHLYVFNVFFIDLITWQLTSGMEVKGNLDSWYIIFTCFLSFFKEETQKYVNIKEPAEITFRSDVYSRVWTVMSYHRQVSKGTKDAEDSSSLRKRQIYYWFTHHELEKALQTQPRRRHLLSNDTSSVFCQGSDTLLILNSASSVLISSNFLSQVPLK